MRQKLKAKEWDEFLAKGKRFRILQPVKIGCVWAADKDGGADLKVLQQFTACLLETVPPEEEQTPKASKREKRDQQSEHQLGAGAGAGRETSLVGGQVTHKFFKETARASACWGGVLSMMLLRAVQGGCFSQPVSLMVTHILSSSELGGPLRMGV